MHIDWRDISQLTSRKYKCGFCGQPLSSEKGWSGRLHPRNVNEYIYICHSCFKPTYFDADGKQTPGVTYGDDVEGIDDKTVQDLYDEARHCTSANAFTAAVLCCRKLLMHIAVAKGATENQAFIDYVQFLSDKNFIPPDAKDWVDHIRAKGNEANHEIVIMNEEAAKDLLSFCGMLLKIIYEFPATVKKRKEQAQ